MSIIIKEADLEKDQDVMIATLNKNRKSQTDVKRYEWLYKANPSGKARAWLAVDDNTGDIAGFTSVIPRMMHVFGEEMACWNCSDFSINKRYRTLGVAVKLRRAAKECVDNNIVPFLYAHPNDRMRVIHVRVGHNEIGKMVRFAKLLKVDVKVRKIIKNRIISKCISIIGNILLNLRIKKHKCNPLYKFEVYKDNNFRFDESYDKLFEEVVASDGIYGVRNSKYLNWRYVECPLYSTETAVIRKENKLAGYIIYMIEDGVAIMKDVFSIKDEEVEMNLVCKWIQYIKEKGVYSISATFFNTSRWIKIFEDFGFISRPEDTSSVFVYPNPTNKFANRLLNSENWYMTVGDRDV